MLQFASRLVLAVVVVSTSLHLPILLPTSASEQLDFGQKYLNRPVPPGFHGARIYTFGQITPAGAGFGSFQERENYVGWSTVFPPCSELSDVDKSHNVCIESLASRRIGEENWSRGIATNWRPDPTDTVVTESSTTASSTYRSLPKFAQETRDGFPIGGLARVWSLEGAQHYGGTSYLLGVGYNYDRNSRVQVTSRQFSISLVPVALGPRNIKGGHWPLGYGSAFEFTNTHEFRVQIRMGKFLNEIGGWTQGRILDPKISLQDQLLTISGRPSKSLIAMAGPLSCEDWPDESPATSDLCKNRTPSAIFNQTIGILFGNSFEDASRVTNFYPKGAFEYWKDKIRPEVYSSSWSLVSLGIERSGNCDIPQDRIGIVSSDAMLYSTAPPTWNAEDQSLNYQVASLPKGPSGETVLGNFNIAMPRTFATCLWGVNVNSAVAQVSITSSDGSPRVATSSLSTDEENLYFKVSGFTFSSPTIKVRLVAESPTNAVVQRARKIICKRGAKTKSVEGINPKCPKGFTIKRQG